MGVVIGRGQLSLNKSPSSEVSEILLLRSIPPYNKKQWFKILKQAVKQKIVTKLIFEYRSTKICQGSLLDNIY